MSKNVVTNELKQIFSQNLAYYMQKKDINTADLARALSYPFTTVSDWVHGRKYPRMDKVQAIADYFDILKSDLTEEHFQTPIETVQKEKMATNGLQEIDESKPPIEDKGLREKDVRLIKWFRSLPPEKQKAILISQDGPTELAD